MVGNSATVTLAGFRNPQGAVAIGEMITRMEESLAAFRDEAKQNRKPEPGALGRVPFQLKGLDAETKILPAPGQR